MKRHDTPHDVAIALSRHAPRIIGSLLDPAVGGGNLIVPLLQRLRRNDSQVYCIDSDRDAIDGVAKTYGKVLPQRSYFVHSDFLSWSVCSRTPQFDCVVMNPPFAAIKSCLYPLVLPEGGSGTRSVRYAPLEAAFLYRAIDLLEPNGRLLAVVPCSVVMSDGLQWLRDRLLKTGAIRFVHELPPRSFPGVESRMYLMVFDKGVRHKKIALFNHDLHEPERLTLSLDDAVGRLDFGFASAQSKLSRLGKYKWLQWRQMKEMASVIRGDIDSPSGPRCAVHSTDFRDGFWHSSDRHDSSVGESEDRRVRRGDFLMSRVGRNSCRSVGKGIGICGMPCSDCVLIVRPIAPKLGWSVYFALRVLFTLEWTKPLVERGTGASYISHDSLLELPIPMGLSARYPRQFRTFVEGEKARAFRRSGHAIKSVGDKLERLLA